MVRGGRVEFQRDITSRSRRVWPWNSLPALYGNGSKPLRAALFYAERSSTEPFLGSRLDLSHQHVSGISLDPAQSGSLCRRFVCVTDVQSKSASGMTPNQVCRH
jgi:hypothetical protein